MFAGSLGHGRDVVLTRCRVVGCLAVTQVEDLPQVEALLRGLPLFDELCGRMGLTDGSETTCKVELPDLPPCFSRNGAMDCRPNM